MNNSPHFAAFYRWLVIKNQLNLPRQASRILDLGCDDGFILRQFSAKLRLGIDQKPRLRPDDKLTVVQAKADQLALIDDSFDLILAFDVLEHIENHQGAMQELLRVLTPSGTLWFSTPTQNTQMIPAFFTPYTNRSFGHVRNGYTIEQIKNLLPASNQWLITHFFWNEPLFRLAFVPLHFLNLALPKVAAYLTKECYLLDRYFSQGKNGHLFGTIRRDIAQITAKT